MENILERILRQRRIAVAREFAGADLEPVSYTHLTLPTTPYV